MSGAAPARSIAVALAACVAAGAACAHPARPRGAPGARELTATVVTGRFVLADGRSATSPDGDTVRFVPDRPESLCARKPCPNGINVRVASVDALELHYDCGHQDLALASAGRDRLLSLLGFTSVAFRDADGTTVASATPASVRGHLLATGPDTGGKRVVAYLYAGDPPSPDGTERRLDPADVRGSVNHALLAEGFAYPAYYEDSVTPEAMAPLDETVAKARAEGRGVWARRASPAGPAGTDVVWPAIARRHCKWVLGGGSGGAAAFVAWLNGPAKDDGHPYWDRARKRRVRLGEVVAVEGDAVVLTVPPERLVARP